MQLKQQKKALPGAFVVSLRRLGSIAGSFITLRLGWNSLALISLLSCYGRLQHRAIFIELALQMPDNIVPSFQLVLQALDSAIFHFHLGVFFLQSVLQLSQTAHFRCGCSSTPPKTQTPCLLFASGSAAMHHSPRVQASNGILGLRLLDPLNSSWSERMDEKSLDFSRSLHWAQIHKNVLTPPFFFISASILPCSVNHS